MSPAEEIKFLQNTLAYLDQPANRWSWPMFMAEAIVFLALVAVAIWFYERPGGASLEHWAVLVGSFLGGAVVGIVSLSRHSHQRWAVLRHHVDKDRIRARLNELGA